MLYLCNLIYFLINSNYEYFSNLRNIPKIFLILGTGCEVIILKSYHKIFILNDGCRKVISLQLAKIYQLKSCRETNMVFYILW